RECRQAGWVWHGAAGRPATAGSASECRRAGWVWPSERGTSEDWTSRDTRCRPATRRSPQAGAQHLFERLAPHACAELEGGGELRGLDRIGAAEALGELVHERLGQQDVPHEPVDPLLAPPPVRVEIGELGGKELPD